MLTKLHPIQYLDCLGNSGKKRSRKDASVGLLQGAYIFISPLVERNRNLSVNKAEVGHNHFPV